MPAEPVIEHRGGAGASARAFWQGRAGAALLPAAWLFGAVVRTRARLYASGVWRREKLPVPVISVGNLVVGGSGKTPVSAWLIDRLLERDRRPALLHVGNAEDEPALHRAWHPQVPVFAGRDRLANAQRAIQQGADVIVLDDAFQHLRLRRDLDLLLMAAESWRWPRRLLPAGAWREPIDAARRASLIGVTRKSGDPRYAADVAGEVVSAFPGAAIMRIAIEPAGWTLWTKGETHDVTPRAQPYLLVSGVAHPESVLEQARAAGLQVGRMLAFDDHHTYRAGDLDPAAGERTLPIATTEKDAVKLRVVLPDVPLLVLRQRVRIERGGDLFEKELDRVLA